MTVQELVDFLQKLPKDTVIGVVFRACSDLVVLEEEDMQFMDKTVLDAHDGAIYPPTPYSNRTYKYVMRNGKLMEYDERTWDPKEIPQFVPVLILPGN